MELGERAESLAHHVIAPLLVGGALTLDRPLGRELGLDLARDRRVVDEAVRSEIDLARRRVARAILPIDVLDELGEAEWAMAAALNDLLQVTNPELSSFASRGRHQQLLADTAELCAAIPPCRSLPEAVARHATFSRVLGLYRRDKTVRWWTGSGTFRGQEPPARLLAWPGLRRVRVSEQRIALPAMADDEAVPVGGDAFRQVLASWLSLSPLTDLATAHRAVPAFSWTAQNLSLIAIVAGSNLALRAHARVTGLSGTAVATALKAMRDSASRLTADSPAQRMAFAFTEGLQAADACWGSTASG